MRHLIQLLEENSKPQDIEIIELNFTDREVKPVFSQDSLDLHYNKLAKGYAKRYNDKEGDRDFNYAGVFLHNLLFTQFREYRNNNKPNGPIAGFIDKHFKSYDDFKEKFTEVALTIQGSGWVYLSTEGSIKTIKNHEVVDDILILVDMWEHAFLLDYGSDKKKYLSEQWKIINWNVISTRWGRSL
jgi:Fe-Mn family superoxide dismutase